MRLVAGGGLEGVGALAGDESFGQGDARAREDGDQATHACPCVGSGVGAGQTVEGLHVQNRVEAEAGGEGVHGLVLAGRGAVGEPDVADGAAEARGEGVAGAVGVPPQGEDGPGCADGERGGPAGEDAVHRLVAVQPGAALGHEHAPLVAGRGEQHVLAQQPGDGGDGLGPGAADQQGAGGGAGLGGGPGLFRRHDNTLGRFVHLARFVITRTSALTFDVRDISCFLEDAIWRVS